MRRARPKAACSRDFAWVRAGIGSSLERTGSRRSTTRRGPKAPKATTGASGGGLRIALGSARRWDRPLRITLQIADEVRRTDREGGLAALQRDRSVPGADDETRPGRGHRLARGFRRVAEGVHRRARRFEFVMSNRQAERCQTDNHRRPNQGRRRCGTSARLFDGRRPRKFHGPNEILGLCSGRSRVRRVASNRRVVSARRTRPRSGRPAGPVDVRLGRLFRPHVAAWAAMVPSQSSASAAERTSSTVMAGSSGRRGKRHASRCAWGRRGDRRDHGRGRSVRASETTEAAPLARPGARRRDPRSDLRRRRALGKVGAGALRTLRVPLVPDRGVDGDPRRAVRSLHADRSRIARGARVVDRRFERAKSKGRWTSIDGVDLLRVVLPGPVDGTQGQFSGLELRGLPARLVRRDPQTQVVIRRSRVLDGRWKSLPIGARHESAIRWLLQTEVEDVVLIAPTHSRTFDEELAARRLLQREGIAEP